jgi:hypothetical protein
MSQAVRAVSTLCGLWRRSIIIRPDGTRDAATSVRWLQGPSAYVDLRQPSAQPDFSGVRGLADLSWENCVSLAQQEGFAGKLVSDGSWFEWQRCIDFQPKTGRADSGSLTWERDVLVERGREIAYVEHWHRDPHPTTTPVYALTLRDARRSRNALLVRVGPAFMFARDRNVVPRAGRTLSERIVQAPSLQQARDLIDCEISFGAVEVEAFTVTASTLPYRVGDNLGPRYAEGGITMHDRAPDGDAIRRRWEITSSEGRCEGGLAGADDASRR